MKYHILKANMLNYEDEGFKRLYAEEKAYGHIFWYIGKDKVYHINKDDICYIYYINLPDSSNRILFEGKVINSDYGNNGKSIFKDALPGEKYIEMELRYVALEDKNKYSKEELEGIFKVTNINKRTSHINIDKEHNESLIANLDHEDKRWKTLRTVTSYFDEFNKCEFGCKTFEKENGFYYIERHHLVERNLIDKNTKINNITKLIDNPSNLFNLCPMCHMKIHHGKKEVRREMVKTLYNKKKSFFDNQYKALRGDKKTLDWLYEIYKCN